MGHHHSHSSHPVRGPLQYEEPVTQKQKRTWRIKGIIWMVLAGILVITSIVLAIVFSVIETERNLPGPVFLALNVYIVVPLAFGIPNLRQGYTHRPQVTQVYESNYKKLVFKDKVECPKCSAENQFGDAYCKQCNEPLPKRCPLCGAEIIENDEACRDCGLALI